MTNLEEARSVYSTLIDVVKSFKSPAIKSFFLRKADEDFSELNKKITEGKFTCVIKPYLTKQKDLIDVLKRQSVVYNMYFDKNSNF
ncbi:hypothetical protein TUBRATIS_17780 [Tubulinosema ratisbonensis]|uniref:Uncharacterized protein n=1 Tax=Tubulinosema ratisbonensis TaxID=291195 RepID=A0A437AKX4_9MICR|nr:hypothetical protein TUBRATIS_17780 [Tubulinosema ratisbonensis]